MEGFSCKGGKVVTFLSSGCVLKFAQSSVCFLVVPFFFSFFSFLLAHLLSKSVILFNIGADAVMRRTIRCLVSSIFCPLDY